MNKISLLFMGVIFAAHAAFAGELVTAENLFNTDQEASRLAWKLDERMQQQLNLEDKKSELAQAQQALSDLQSRRKPNTKELNFAQSRAYSLYLELKLAVKSLELNAESVEDTIKNYVDLYGGSAKVASAARTLAKTTDTNEIKKIIANGGTTPIIAAAMN